MSPVRNPISERPCRAMDPANCRVHGFPARFVDLEKVTPAPTRPRPIPRPILTDVEPVEQALLAPARWEGIAPTWWKGFSEKVEELDHGNKPDLLDVINTPAGELGVIWLKNSPTRGDIGTVERDGMRVNYIALYDPKTDEAVGYIKTTSVDEETFSAAFGDDELTPYRYAKRYRGGFYATLPNNEEWKSLSDEEKLPVLQKAWRAALQDTGSYIERADGSFHDYRTISDEDVPQTLEQVRQSLAETANSTYDKEISWHRKYYSLPYIDYSSVEEPLKGKGYGSALYIYAARRLAEDGKVLRGSGLQTDQAQNVWKRLSARFPDQVSIMTLPDLELRSTEYPIFDLR